MTRFVVDAGAVIHLASGEAEVAGGHQLLAPTLLRSQVLCALHEKVHGGDMSAEAARATLDGVGRMKIRLLGDAVLRRRAWDVADQLGWASTYAAEYVALAQLQGDALVTLDRDFARAVEALVRMAPIAALAVESGHD